jgi:hypothetical protein
MTSPTLLFWKFFYLSFTCFITFFCCLDSWEYLYQSQTNSFQHVFSHLTFTVFQSQAYSSITSLAFFSSLYYLFPFLCCLTLLFMSSSLFVEELCFLFLVVLVLFLSIRLGLGMTNLLLPLYFEDLFYYQSHDSMFDFEFKWMLNPHEFLIRKRVFFLFCFCLMIGPFFLFLSWLWFPFLFFMFKQKKVVLFFVLFLSCVGFFEMLWMFSFTLTFFFICYCEILSLFYSLLRNYQRFPFS